MSSRLLTILVLVPTVAVIVAMVVVMWSARISLATSRAAIVGGIALRAWALVVAVLGRQDAFVQPRCQRRAADRDCLGRCLPWG